MGQPAASAAGAPVSPHRPRPGTRFKMQQRMFSIGQDFWIENDRGQKVFQGRRQGHPHPRHAHL
ncbi:MAG: hypothetical protein R2851_04300 [Caldilineaceae bacterium]